MGRRLVVGTAGHIDHGKTALVKALTGVDTDRWEEEKRRGITIDLGFAPLSLGDDLEASVVDVPGHEGFVRNMLAGATGIDVALLVIAADEGVMPQTEEHLAIIELLGIRRGVPVLTKRDAVDDGWLALVREEVTGRLAASRVRWEPPVDASALTGAGLDDVRASLRRVALDLGERPGDDLFRLPIDRVFAVAGAGTVITGSVWSGTVVVGDFVRLLPLDREVRIRSIEVHGEAAERALPGRRTALALVGVDVAELARGDVAVTGTGWNATTRLDAFVELLPAALKPIAPRTRVRLHLGTAEVLARAAPVGEVAPGAEGVARFVLETPLVARGGDRFVLRSYSPVTTIGGGVVFDPFPPRGPVRVPRRRETPAERLAGWVANAGLAGIPTSDVPVRLGILPGEVAAMVASVGKGVLPAEDWLVGRGVVAAEVEKLGALLDAHHAAHPLDAGMSLQALRAAVGDGTVPEPIVDQALHLGVRKRAFDVAESIVRRPGWEAVAAARAGGDAERIGKRVAQAEWQVPTVAELEKEFPGLPVRALLVHLVREGGVVQVDQGRYAAPAALARFRAALEGAIIALGPVTPAQLRDRLGLTRKYLIPLLEWADGRGITRRDGDARVLVRLTAGGEAV